MRRPTIAALVVVTGLLLLIDLLVVNESLGEIAGLLIDAVILVAAGTALAGVASLAWRRGRDLWRRYSQCQQRRYGHLQYDCSDQQRRWDQP